MSQPQHPDRIGRYQIIKPLGAGAMGDVFLARDPNIDRQLAIKTVRVIGANDDDLVERKNRLLREARAAGRLLHPNVVALFDADEAGGVLYLAFEFVAGQDLSQRMRKTPELTLREALRIVRETASALAYAHRNEIVHRDIKPSNILIGTKGEAKVADFGIAKLTNQSVELTRTGSVVGSPQYMAPEQIRGEALDGRSDLFSLGVVLYELLCRNRPFGGDTISTLVFEILSKEPMPIESLRPGLPPRLVNLVRGLLAKDRDQRISSADQVVSELEALERDLPAVDLDRPAAFQPSEHQPTQRMSSSGGVNLPQPPPSPPPFVPPAPFPLAPPTQGPGMAGSGHPQNPTLARGQGPTGTAVQSAPAPSYPVPPAGYAQPPGYPPPAPPGAAGGGYGAPAPPIVRPKPSSAGKILLVLVVFCLLGLGGAVFLLLTMGKKDDKKPATAQKVESAAPELPPVDQRSSTEAQTVDQAPPPSMAIDTPPPAVERPRDQPSRPTTTSPPVVADRQPPPVVEPRTEPERTPPADRAKPPGRGGVLERLGEAARNANEDIERSPDTAPRESPAEDPEPARSPANDAWAEAAKNANREMESGRRFHFKVTPPEAKVLFWQQGDRRAIIQGAAGDFDPKKDENTRTLELPGDGDFLIILRHAGMPDHVILAHADGSRGQAPKLIQLTMGSGTRIGDTNAGATLRVAKSISFAGSPSDAVVIVDGKRRGFASEWPGGAKARSDDNLKLDRGRHVIRIEAPGYQAQEFIVIVAAGATPTDQVSYRLTREP